MPPPKKNIPFNQQSMVGIASHEDFRYISDYVEDAEGAFYVYLTVFQ